jgi:beta-lactamase superfamily II metal-dependent hydrolase
MKNKIILIVVIVIGLIVFLSLIAKNEKDYPFNIYFFDVGKADAILISENGHYILIDTATEEYAEKIVSYLKLHNIKTIDYLIITHFDKDHVGGASKVIKSINIDNIITSNYDKDSNAYDNFIEAVKDKKMGTTILREDMTFTLGNVEFTINAPLKEEYEVKPSNNSSLIVSVKHNNNKFLFMGDAQAERIYEYLDNHNDSYDLLKVPYHGHMQESMDKLISVIKPKHSVITSSYDEMEDMEVLDILNKYGSKIYLTREGSILFTSDGNNIVVN